MASKEEKGGCVTLTWEIQNFSLLLSMEAAVPCCTHVWKTEHNGKSVWRKLGVTSVLSFIAFNLFPAAERLPLDLCKFSLISSGMEVPLKLWGEDSENWSHTVERDDVFGEKRQSNLPNDTLTVRCKMWEKTMKSQEFRINSVLHRFSYLWNIENFQTYMYYGRYIEKENLVFCFYLESYGEGTHRLIFSDVSSKECDASLSNFKITDKNGCVRVIERNCPLNEWICMIKINRKTKSLNLQLESVFAVHKVCHDPFKLPSPPRYEEVSGAVSGALGENLLLLYRDKLFSDATINAEGKSFHVHRNILASRSPVFRAMFEKDNMSESHEGIVDIDDVDSETVDRMLVYLYGDSLESLQQWEEASALYYAADKYDIQPLKHKCAISLKEGLTVDNACEALVLADRHSDDQLMKCIVDFIRQNEEVISSKKWDGLQNSNPLLVAKILREMYLKVMKK